MVKYDELLDEANDMMLQVHESTMPVSSIKGLYVDGNIIIEKNLVTRSEKACVLAEEIGHAKYTVGDIIDQHNISKALYPSGSTRQLCNKGTNCGRSLLIDKPDHSSTNDCHICCPGKHRNIITGAYPKTHC